MAAKKQASNIPAGGLTSWGGTRSIQRRLERSNTLIQNREAVSYALLCMANTKLTDIMTWDEEGNVKVKASHQIPEHALQAIKKIQVRVDKEGNNTLEIELYDKVGVLRLLAKASGLLDNPDENDKPSVIDVNVVAPNAR
jgi:hypothetical protein